MSLVIRSSSSGLPGHFSITLLDSVFWASMTAQTRVSSLQLTQKPRFSTATGRLHTHMTWFLCYLVLPAIDMGQRPSFHADHQLHLPGLHLGSSLQGQTIPQRWRLHNTFTLAIQRNIKRNVMEGSLL